MEKSSPERQFKGIRIRKWGRWVSEIRMPKSREKIWLGSYKTAEHAARAYDAALYCLKGPAAKFNFPDSVPAIPSASSLSRQQIQVAAAKYALDEIPSTSFSLQDMKNNNNKSKEKDKPISLPRPSSISEMELSCDSPRIWESQDLGLLESPFYSNGGLNLEKIQSIDEVWALEFIPIWQEEQQQQDEVWALEFIPIWQEEQQQQEYLFFDTTDLWNF